MVMHKLKEISDVLLHKYTLVFSSRNNFTQCSREILELESKKTAKNIPSFPTELLPAFALRFLSKDMFKIFLPILA